MEWDTAATECIVEAAGGGVYSLDGQPCVTITRSEESGNHDGWRHPAGLAKIDHVGVGPSYVAVV